MSIGEHSSSQIWSILINEASTSGRRLSAGLREQLQSLPRHTRKAVVDHSPNGFTPLVAACFYENVEMVEYLITECDANIEQSSTEPRKNSLDRRMQRYTPLCWACALGKMPIITSLIRLGANVEGVSECGSTPLQVACRTENVCVAEYLMDNGADIRKSNKNNETYLMSSVRSTPMCRFLIEKGLDVNACDTNDQTALHNSTEGRCIRTISLLLDYGANPFAKTRRGDDVLQLACIKAEFEVADYLMSRITYTPERKADANELLGALSFLVSLGTRRRVLRWRKALQIRLNGDVYIQKRPVIPPRSAFEDKAEFSTFDELEAIAVDVNEIRIQSLLIVERVLGADHEKTLMFFMAEGEYFRRVSRIQKCLDLWLLVLQRRVQKLSILHYETTHIARTIISYMVDLFIPNVQFSLRFEDVCAVFQFLASDVIEKRQLVRIRPVDRVQLMNHDFIVHCLTHLIYILHSLADSEPRREFVENSVRELIHNDIRCVITNRTLLHLSLRKVDMHKVSVDEVFPDIHVVKLLLDCGAHLDIPDLNGTRPSNLLEDLSQHDIHPINFISLECLCATALTKSGIPYQDQLPHVLESFVRAHAAPEFNYKF